MTNNQVIKSSLFKPIVICLLLVCWQATPCRGQNNPFVDDKLFHMGFQLGLNLMSYGITDSNQPIAPLGDEVLYARVSSLLPGFCVAFVMDVRLSKHLNLRITPGLEFAQRTISYATKDGPFEGWAIGVDKIRTQNLLCIPITVPVYLKWSANRERNYRPYLLVGGGVAFNVNPSKVDDYVQTKVFDGFVEGGFGCDFYFSWFKFCPQLTYRVGFANQIQTIDTYITSTNEQQIFTTPISRMLNRELVLTFNFE